METKYIPGDSVAFIKFIQELGIGDKANLKTIEGKFRWVITAEDGTEYIARPEEADPNK